MLEWMRAGRPRTREAVAHGALTRARGGSALPARGLEYAVLDVETTGLDPASGARVCEVAVVRMRGDGTVLREFSTLVDPGAPMAGREFHGITDGDAAGAPRVGALAGELAGLFSGAVVAGHNLDFEAAFLASELVPAGLPEGVPGLCTLRALRSQVDLDRYSLPRASLALNGHWPSGQHTALGDARACARILAEMLNTAPGELYYTGPAPRELVLEGQGAERGGPVRLKSRTTPKGALPLATVWPRRWRPQELPPELCGGPFTDTDRAAALKAARERGLRREAVAGAAALAGAAAAAGAARSLLRVLR
ncbi:3'-5' exonuclease [Nocardiopsis chromatogenes]|uniref:3'-5' exonuclease n=1 Tax=Nocardiopsis chromatogenes TaxID=280239 RepID=UPI0003466275|nr:3'-5' exonuclease [Nocardiopsis chromatogenes]